MLGSKDFKIYPICQVDRDITFILSKKKTYITTGLYSIYKFVVPTVA
jgi:hypothetical protein